MTTYFGSVVTVGNTILNQNLSVQGAYVILGGNTGPLVNQGSNIGTVAAPFSVVYTTSANVPSITLSTVTGTIGINTTNDGLTGVKVSGNTWTSNALTTPSIYASNANVLTLNTLVLSQRARFVGTDSSANATVTGNVLVSNALSAPVILTTNANVLVLNTAVLSQRSMLGTDVSANLTVAGNIWAANTLSAPVVKVTGANVLVLNTSQISNTALVIGNIVSTATLSLNGNLWATTSIASNLLAPTTSANTPVLNTTNMRTFTGIGVTGSGATLNVLGNVWASNTLGALWALPSTSMNTVTLNVSSFSNATYQTGVGVVAVPVTPSNVFSNVQGFARVTRAVSNLVLDTSVTAASYVNLGTSSPARIDPTTNDIFIEAWIYVPGNLGTNQYNVYSVSNTTATNDDLLLSFTKTGASFSWAGSVAAQASATISQGTWTHIAGLFQTNPGSRTSVWVNGGSRGAGTTSTLFYSSSNPTLLGASRGGLYGSTDKFYIADLRICYGATLTRPTSFTPDPAPFSAAAPSYIGGTLNYVMSLWHLAANPTLIVTGNVWTSNSLEAPTGRFTNVYATSTGIDTPRIFSPTTGDILGIGQTPVTGGAKLQVTGNLWASNALQTGTLVASVNTTTFNVLSVFGSTAGRVGIGTSTNLGGNLHVQNNVWVSNALSAPNVLATTSANTAVLNTYTISNIVGVGTAPVATGAALQVTGNIWASNGYVGNIIVSGTSVLNTVPNVNSFYGTGNVAIGMAPTQAQLSVAGNVWASNAITAPSIILTSPAVSNITTMNTPSIYQQTAYRIGINTSTNLGGNVHVLGNVYTSNTYVGSILVTGGIANTLVNVSTMSNLVGVNAPASTSATVNIAGNIYVSNSFTGNVFVPTLNVLTNTNFITSASTSLVGVQTATNLGANLHVFGNVYASNGLESPFIGTSMNTLANVRFLMATDLNGIGVGATNGLGASLAVNGNLYVSNSYSDGLVVTSGLINAVANVATIYATTSNGVTISSTSNIGAALGVSGNLYVSNSYSGNFIVTSDQLNTFFNVYSFVGRSSAGVGIATAPSNANLGVFGNVWASNAYQGNIVLTSPSLLNVTTLNVTSILGTAGGKVGFNTTTGGSTVQIQAGNIYASNAYSGNIIATTSANVTTLNVAYVYSNITTGGSRFNVNGNLYASNAISALNVTVTTIQATYDEDVTRRGLHTLPTTSNASTITAWMSATANASMEPGPSYWTSTAVPVFSNLGTGPTTSLSYKGSLLMPDGRVLFVPYSSGGVIGFYNPKTNEYSEVTPNGDSINGGLQYSGSVLLPNGNVVFIPSSSSNIGQYNPVENIFSNILSGLTGFSYQSSSLLGTGNIIFASSATSSAIEYDPDAGTLSTTLLNGGSQILLPSGNVYTVGTTTGTQSWNPYTRTRTIISGQINFISGTSHKACLSLDGNVVFVPSASTANAVVVTPVTVSPVWSNIVASVSISSSFSAGVTLPTGNIICVPQRAINVGMIDPVNMTYSNIAGVGGTTTTDKYYGGTLLPSGQVIFCPWQGNVGILNTFTPAPREMCLSPYFNRS